MTPGARWSIPRIAEGDAARLAEALGVRRPVARALLKRGYSEPEAARRFLEPSLDGLHDPFLMQDMAQASSRLVEAIRRKEPILLYGDYDVDGATSVVILKRVIELAGGQASFHVPDRLREGYGMRPEVIEQAAEEGVKLLVSVDTGIRAAAEIRHACALGIDVIVTDHHLPESELPPALAVINPKRPDCGYPEKNLCGAGIVFKLADALLRAVDWSPERRRRLVESLLKLVAIATVADVVPLTGENRILVKHGLEGLRSVRNPGLRALLDVAGFAEGDAPTAPQVAFRVAPRMNAAGRMASAADVIELFLTEDPARARNIAGRLHLWNQERQEAETEVLRRILEECARVPVTAGDKALVFSGPGWHRGVVGIVASRLVDRFHRPAVVLDEDSEKGLAHGSGRSIPAFHLLEALESMPDLFVAFGGHRQAAGVTLRSDRIDEFRKRLNEYAFARLADEDLVAVLELDGVVDVSEIDDASVAEILALAPFGCDNPAPVFAILDAEVAGEPRVLKEKHLRLSLRQSGRTLSLVAWNSIERALELRSGARIDAAVSFEDNPQGRQRGYRGWSAVFKDFRAASAF